MQDFGFYIFLILAFIVGVTIVKKITTCLFKLVATAVIIIIMIVLYYGYFAV